MKKAADQFGSSRIPRVAAYLRVSTGRQAESDLSIPDQNRQIAAYCDAKGWVLADTFIEPGATATDDNRPEFQKLIERATDKDHPFDVILVHSYSRFFRDAFHLEFYLRKLGKCGVVLVSITQELGNDPAQAMMRQIIALFDEYQSKETGKHVLRTMLENARQGFYNGSPLPLGYTAEAVETRGVRIKKRIVIDLIEAETVRLIFELYLRGDGKSGPLGLKSIASYLNSSGRRTRRGGRFGFGTLHQILRNRMYLGEFVFNRVESKTGRVKPVEERVSFSIPRIIEDDDFLAVQNKLSANAPAMSPPRLVNSPILLSGLAICATCGNSMMLRTGTGRNGTVHRYYTCYSQARYGKDGCVGRSIRMDVLDTLVTDHLTERLLVAPRVAEIIATVADRRAVKAAELDGRISQLKRDAKEADERLSRLYRMMEDGHINADDMLKSRVTDLQTTRENAHAALARAINHCSIVPEVDATAIDKFVELMRTHVSEGDNAFRRAYIRSVVHHIEVDDAEIRIVGPNEAIHANVRQEKFPAPPVRSFERKWHALGESNPSSQNENLVS